MDVIIVSKHGLVVIGGAKVDSDAIEGDVSTTSSIENKITTNPQQSCEIHLLANMRASKMLISVQSVLKGEIEADVWNNSETRRKNNSVT